MSLLSMADKFCPEFCQSALLRVKNSSIGTRIIGNGLWSVLGTAFAKSFTFLAMILVARLIGKEGFSDFGFVRTTALTYTAFSSFGVGLTATKFVSELLPTDKARAGRIIGLSYLFTFFSSAIVATIFFFVVPWLCISQMNVPHLVNEMRLGAVLLFLLTVMGTQQGVMAGFHDFRGSALATIASGILSLPLFVIGAYFAGLWGALIGLLATTFINIVFNSLFVFRNLRKHDMRYSFASAYKELPVLWKFSLPTLCCSVTYSTMFWLCQLILRASANGGSEFGFFVAASEIYTIILFIPTSITPIFLSMLSELHGKKDKAAFRKTVLVHLSASLAITALVAVPTMLFAKQIMGLYGVGFVDGYLSLVVLCLAAVVFSVSLVVDQIVASQNRMWLNYAYCLWGASVMLFLCYVFVTNGVGSLGLALAMLGGAVARLLFFFVYSIVRRTVLT